MYRCLTVELCGNRVSGRPSLGFRLWSVREAIGGEARVKDGPEGRLQSKTSSLRTL